MKTPVYFLFPAFLLISGAGLSAEPETAGAEETSDIEAQEPQGQTDDSNLDDTGAVINRGIVIEEEGDTAAGAEPGDDRFIPTTQISEDLSVSFPVDI